jgi:hypothetical protein
MGGGSVLHHGQRAQGPLFHLGPSERLEWTAIPLLGEDDLWILGKYTNRVRDCGSLSGVHINKPRTWFD